MLNKILLSFNKTFLKFILVGIVNTIFGYSIFSLLIFLGLHYYLATFFATCLGILFNFKTFGQLVFNNAENNLLGKFILVYAFCYLLNITIIKLALWLTINIYLAGALAMLIAALCSYTLNKNWVFQTIKKNNI